jgi:replication-associated recombination protein RarA
MQSGFDFPVMLSEKYRPQRISDFAGLDKPKRIFANLAANPKQCALLCMAPSGTGKTTMALALANEMPAELHHIASKECTLETVRDIARQCHTMPRMYNDWSPAKMHLVLVDEADQMSPAAQLAFLSILDATSFPPNTIFVFTCNSTANLEDRFLSRCLKVEFSSYGMAAPISELLQRVWAAEVPNNSTFPNFQRIVKDACNNVRDALMSLETEIMAA